MIIETERLILRELKEDDVNDLVLGLNNINVAKNLIIPFPYTKDDAVNFISKNIHHSKNKYAFAIELKEEQKLIGCTTLDFNENLNIYGGGIWINEKYHGNGYGPEAFKARAKFAFEELKVENLTNGFLEHNEKSWNMQRKMGYKIVGEKKVFSPALNKEVIDIRTNLNVKDFYNSNK